MSDLLVDAVVESAMQFAMQNGHRGLEAYDEAINWMHFQRRLFRRAINKLEEGRRHYLRHRFSRIADALSRDGDQA